MAFVPDLAIENFHLLTTAEIKIFSLYCKKRNKQTGGWFCPDVQIAEETHLTRQGVFKARAGLEKKGWIKRGENQFVIPVFGFDDVNTRQQNVNTRQHLTSKPMSTCVDTMPTHVDTMSTHVNIALKESYQPILPTHLTSVSADLHRANSANQPDDKNFVPKSSLPKPSGFLGEPSADKIQPARRPTLRLASAGKPADERRNHPAVRMVKKITGRFPPKDQWDKVIREVGASPDTEFFQAAWEIWRSFDGKPTNLQGWLFQPNEKGKLPEVFGKESSNGNGQKTNLVAFEKPKQTHSSGREHTAEAAASEISAARLEGLNFITDMLADGLDISGMKQFYSVDDWTWLEEQLKNQKM